MAWLRLGQPNQLTEENLHLRSALPDLHPDSQIAATTAQRFAQIVRDRLPHAFDEWLHLLCFDLL